MGSLCVILHKHITVIFFIKINLWLSYSYETYKNTKQIQLCYRKQFNSIFSGLDPKGLKGNSHRLRKFLNRNQFSNWKSRDIGRKLYSFHHFYIWYRKKGLDMLYFESKMIKLSKTAQIWRYWWHTTELGHFGFI